MLGLSQFFASPEDRPTGSPALTVISGSMTFRGSTISGTGDLRIEGTVWSDISMDGRIYVAPGAEVYGEVHAQSIMVAGYVEGRLHADGKLVLTPQAVVSASLEMNSLRIDAGARFQGTVQPLERDDPEPSLSLEDEEESSSPIPSRLVTSSAAESSHSDESDPSSEQSSSSTLGTSPPPPEETPSRDEDVEAESSDASSSEESASSNASSSESSEEDDGNESSYGFQW